MTVNGNFHNHCPHLKRLMFSFAYLVLLLTLLPFSASSEPVQTRAQIHTPVTAGSGMVVSDNELATAAGIKVLEEGGNAVDAAVTMGFVLAVTYPRAGNLGGGGFMLISLSGSSGEVIALDYREKAPLSSDRDMFLDKDGRVNNEKSRNSVYSSGVPGTVAGLALALEKYGTITLKRAIKPALEYARNGFKVTHNMRDSLISARERLSGSEESMSVFFKKDGEPYNTGEIFRQHDLAWSLEQISENGPDAFYKGEIADMISGFMEKSGGIITKKDLKRYNPEIREPVKGEYRGYTVYSMPPPSSGGIHLIQMLNILEKYPLASFGRNSARYLNILTEVMKLAYADRSRYLGDSDFVDVPVSKLISDEYSSSLMEKVNTKSATPSSNIKPGNPFVSDESPDTTHFSVMDKHGNAVANTYTLNFSYGSGITIPGTGILLNNEMDDFSSLPGVPNAYGLIGGEFNSIQPEKRMLSSMTPTIVMKNDSPFIVTGAAGGSRIITTVLQILLNVIDHSLNIAESTAAPRVHHQWLPDKTYVENGISPDTVSLLEQMGHNVSSDRTIGTANSVMRDKDYFYGFADPRRPEGRAEGLTGSCHKQPVN